MPRFVTWNMEGSNASTDVKWQTGVEKLVKDFDPDVVCLQECGLPPPSAKIQADFGKIAFVGEQPSNGTIYDFEVNYYMWGGLTTKRHVRHIIHLMTSDKGKKVNSAVLSQDAPASFISAKPGLSGARPAIGMRLSFTTGGIWDVFSLHAWSGGGNDASALLHNISTVNGLATQWAALGDYNREPAQLMKKTIPQGTIASAPDEVTRPKSGAVYDYMVTHKSVRGVVQGTQLSDHLQVRFDV
jgi:cytolethal distending toxin subunit B